tara:strand:+ start:3813 stop:4829 length:1017 start_codon:yes stop_codon:yes gene_type:complete
MNKNVTLLLSSFLLCLDLFASAEEITLYSHRHYESDEALYAKFTKQTGIKVNVVKAGADELIERLKAEGANSKADLLMTVDAGRLQRAKAADLLQSVDSGVLAERIPTAYRDHDNQWFGLSMRARILVYAKGRVKPGELKSYEDLADPRWRGRIAVRSSSSIYNQSLLASIIVEHGVHEARAWAKAVRKNMARPPQGSDRDQMRAVFGGLADIAIVNTYYMGLLINSSEVKDRAVGKDMALFFPNQKGRGAHVNVSGAGVTKSSKNIEAAIRLLEFLVSDEAQASFPQTTYEYPVVEGVPWSDLQKSWGKFRADSLNLGILGELNEAAVTVFNEAGWE